MRNPKKRGTKQLITNGDKNQNRISGEETNAIKRVLTFHFATIIAFTIKNVKLD